MGSTFQNFKGLTLDVDFTIGTEAADVINVALVIIDRDNNNTVGERVPIMWYLADDATGATPTVVAPTGGVGIGTNGAIIEWAANLSGIMIPTAAGLVDIDLQDTGTPTFYLVAIMPDGKMAVSGAITFA